MRSSILIVLFLVSIALTLAIPTSIYVEMEAANDEEKEAINLDHNEVEINEHLREWKQLKKIHMEAVADCDMQSCFDHCSTIYSPPFIYSCILGNCVCIKV